MLKIRTLKVLRKNKRLEEIRTNVTREAIHSSIENTVDEIQEMKINVRIRFFTKGTEWFIIIPTHIRLEKKENGTLVTCISDVTKPVLLSLTFGIFCPVPALLSHQVISYVLLAFIISAIVFTYILNRIIYTTRDYLRELKA